MLKQSSDFQPFEYVKTGYLLIIEESRDRRRGESLGGSGGILLQNVLKSWSSEMPFPVFWEGSFLSKVLAKSIVISMLIFLCVALRTNAWFHFIFCAVFEVFWTSESVKYTLDLLCSCIDIIKFSMEISERMLKSGFFLSWLHIGQDSRFSSKIYNEGQKCWDTSTCITLPLFEQWTYLSPHPVYPCLLPPKPMLYFRPSSLSLTINNIDSGMGGFMALKQNELAP